MSSPKRTLLLTLLALTLVNGLAHFVPFERTAYSNDDLSRLVTYRENKGEASFWIKETRMNPDRPLLVLHYLLEAVAGERPGLAAILVFGSSTLLVWGVYLLLLALLKDRPLALLCSLVYLLLPNKLMTYYNLTFTYMNGMLVLCVASFLAFLLFVRRGHRGWLILSLLFYTASILGYEAGYFLPLVFLVYGLLYARDKLKSLAFFLIPLAAYALWRSKWLGILPADARAPTLQFSRFLPNALETLPQLYFGRPMAKSILYGLYRWPTLEAPWLALVALADVAFLVWLFGWLKGASLPAFRARFLGLCAALFAFMALPACLTSLIYGRHTVLPSIGFVPLALWAGRRIPFRGKRFLAWGLLAAGLVVCQGNAWSQVVASRINGAVAHTLAAYRQEIHRSERVLIDQYDLAQRIPYTWINDRFNHLDFYWGVEALMGGKGSPFLVAYATGQFKPTLVVRSPIRVRGEEWVFQVYNPDRYELEETSVPREGSFLVNYARVYPGGFSNGKRAGGSPE